MAEKIKWVAEHLKEVWEQPEMRVRAGAAALLIVLYNLVALLHVYANPKDITSLMQTELNMDIFEWTHGFMSLYPTWAVFFKLVYYFGFTASLVAAPAYLALMKDRKRLDTLISAIIIAYIVAFPIFFTLVAYEPTTVGWGHEEDMLLYQGQAFASTNFMTKPEFCLPSGHVFLSVIAALAVWGTRKKVRFFFYALGFLVPISTLMLSQHWIQDVLTGLALGVGAFVAAKYLSPYVTRYLDSVARKIYSLDSEQVGHSEA